MRPQDSRESFILMKVKNSLDSKTGSMKNSLLLILVVIMAINVNAQFDYDYIGRDQFYILKSGSDLKSGSSLKASGLKSAKIAEQLYGINFTEKQQFAETKNEYYNELVYDNGLILSIPENQNSEIEFHITSDQYSLMLNNGQMIKVGMKSDDFKAIFTKSFSKRVLSTTSGHIGKTAILVYFSILLDNNVQIEDSWIVFILGENDGALEEFYTWDPS